MADPGGRVRDIDLGYDEFREQLEDLEGAEVTIGFHKGDVESEQIKIASVHEFGAPRANIPQRSFMRTTVDANESRYGRLLESLLKQVVTGDMDLRVALSLLGERVRQDVRNKIDDIQTPPLSEQRVNEKKRKSGKDTIKEVGGSETGNPLVDTGNMKQSVNYEVDLPSL